MAKAGGPGNTGGRDNAGNPSAPQPAVDPALAAAAAREAAPTRPRESPNARELVALIAATSANSPSSNEREAAAAIERRAILHANAFVEAKQPALDTEPDAATRIEARSAALRVKDVEPIPAADARTLAALDSRDFTKLEDPARQQSAASAIAETARNDAAYRAALAEVAPQLATRVAAAENQEQAETEAKELRKGGRFAEISSDRAAVERQREPANDPTVPVSLAANDAVRGTPLSLDEPTIDRLAAARERDRRNAIEQLNAPANGSANSGRRFQEEGMQQRTDDEAQREAARNELAADRMAAGKERESQKADRALDADADSNQISSDEAFAASTRAAKPTIPPEVEARYLRVGDKFYHPTNTSVIAFEDKGSKLETRSNSEQVADTLVTIARSRGWEEIKVSGSETFRKEVWLEAASHGMQVRGYIPSELDKAALAKRLPSVEANRVEPANPRPAEQTTYSAGTQAATRPADSEAQARARAFRNQPAIEAVKAHPELAGTIAIASAIDKKVAADGFSPEQRAIVAARVRTNLVNSIERGELPQAQVRDRVEVERETTKEREHTR